MSKLLRGTALVVVSSFLVSSPALAEEYDFLHADNLPPVSLVIKQALNQLPEGVGELKDYARTIHKAAMAPELRFRMRNYEDITRNFEWVEQRQTRKTTRSTDEDIDTVDVQTRDTVRPYGDPLSSYTEEYTQITETSQDKDSDYTDYYEQFDGPVSLPTSDSTIWLQDFSVDAIWDLSEFFYHKDELQANQITVNIAKFRLEYMEKVAKQYGALKDVLVSLERNPGNEFAVGKKVLAAVMLDEVTGGFITDYAVNNPSKGSSAVSPASPSATETTGEPSAGDVPVAEPSAADVTEDEGVDEEPIEDFSGVDEDAEAARKADDEARERDDADQQLENASEIEFQ